MDNRIKILITEEEIDKRVLELAETIKYDYQYQYQYQYQYRCSDKPIKIICVLTGGIIFMSDLIKKLDLDIKIDFISASSYGGNTKSSGIVKITRDIKDSVKGEHVLLVEDIVDSGLSLHCLKNHLLSQSPASLKVCVFLDKPQRRVKDITLDYIGFEIPNEFVIGYGLDYNQRYRNLPYVGILPEELI